MLIAGEKWACDACVRGHRVSSCTHADRELHHINKKGRPVSQCPHCRGLRKARSSHVRCECAEKDPHLRREPLDTCACGHGQRCTCNLKKDHLGAIPEVKSAKARSRANTEGKRPKLTTANNSDPAMTVFTNGHHKPQHPRNHAGHDFAPYKIPRPHSIHGSNFPANRSFDNLTLSSGGMQGSMFGTALSNLQQENQRLVRSAHGSPGLVPTRFDYSGGMMPLLDLDFPAYNTSVTSSPAGDEYKQFQLFDSYTSPADEVPPPRSAPLCGNFPDWSARDLPLANNLSATYNQAPPSYASFDQSHMSVPDMNNSSSAEVSEVEDYTTQGMLSPGRLGAGSPFIPSPPDTGVVQFGANAAFQPNGQANYNLPGLDGLTMESFTPTSPTSPFDPQQLSSNNISPDPEAFTRHGITVQDAQKLAHPGYASAPTVVQNPIAGVRPSVLPMSNAAAATTVPMNDPSWASAFPEDDNAGFVNPSLQMHDQNWM